MMKKSLLLLSFPLFVVRIANAQGCSDAGVCSAGPIGQLPLWQDSVADVVDYRHSGRLLYGYAVGEQSVTIMQVQPELNIGIGSRSMVQVKVPYVFTSGELGENSGMGDVIVSGSYAFLKEHGQSLTGTIGFRLPTGSTNATTAPDKGSGTVTLDAPTYALPMPYQTGLGTLDLLVGAQYRHQRWTLALAWQHVLDNSNDNGFSHAAWNDDPEVLGYFESDMLDRGDDLVARAQYSYGCGRLALQPGLLAILHLQDDTRLGTIAMMSELSAERIEISGSQGLTLNLTADLRYKLAEQWAVEAIFGTPMITREARPDGLTRALVTGLALRYRF